MNWKRQLLIFLAVSTLLAFSFNAKDLFRIPPHWPKPFYDFSKNQLSISKVELGRALFYDPLLSKNNSVSCENCHSPFTAFAHVDHKLSHGIDDRIGTRNAPALMNLAWNTSFMWDGAINHLDMQALAPISHPDEMAETLENVVKKLQASPTYPNLFYKAFNDSNISGEHLLKALSQFMLTLISSNSRYDSVMLKKANFNTQELNGYHLFQKHCTACHTEPLFTNFKFENNGLRVDPILKDIGRMKITLNSKDSLKFKVPTLRNIEYSYPYMHDGRFKNLNEVLNHYNSGIEKNKTLSPLLQKTLTLTSNEKVDIIAFLVTLTDKSFLFNSRFSFPKKNLLPDSKE
jgi:cytochrome c peroxidase